MKDKSGGYRIDRRRAGSICLMGPAGAGKSEVVRQVAEEHGVAFLSYSVTHHTRQNANGLPKLAAIDLSGYTMSEIVAEICRTMNESGKRRHPVSGQV